MSDNCRDIEPCWSAIKFHPRYFLSMISIHSIQELIIVEMNKEFNELCVDEILKPKHNHLKIKGLTHIIHMPKDFQVKWSIFFLSRIHNGQLWLDHPILITKNMIHGFTRLLMLNKDKTTKTIGWVELTKWTLVEWDKKAMKLSGMTNMELKFGIHVISHKIYNSSQLNSVSCEVFDLAYDVVKKNLSFDLAELLLI